MPSGYRTSTYYGRPYYTYGGAYYRPYHYGGVHYYYPVPPPYYAYYSYPPPGATNYQVQISAAPFETFWTGGGGAGVWEDPMNWSAGVPTADPSEAGPPLQVRIGISAGEPVTDKGDLFGTAVQLAARLCASAEPGGVLVSHAVRELCAGKTLAFDAARDLELRGFEMAVRAYAALPSTPAG